MKDVGNCCQAALVCECDRENGNRAERKSAPSIRLLKCRCFTAERHLLKTCLLQYVGDVDAFVATLQAAAKHNQSVNQSYKNHFNQKSLEQFKCDGSFKREPQG